MSNGKVKFKRRALIYEWISRNQKLWYPVNWDRESPLRRNLMSYQHMLIYQTLVNDGLYSEKTEPTDALRSFRRYIIQYREDKKTMNINFEKEQKDDEPIFTGFDEEPGNINPAQGDDKEPGTLDFPYLMIDSEKVKKLASHTGGIKALVKKTASDIIRIGEKLIQVKELLGHGDFGLWLKEEFGWTWRTANNFMNVAQQFKLENFSNLKTSTSALYLLASGSTPEAVRDEFTEKIQSGEEVTHKEVKDAIEEHQGHEETAFDEEPVSNDRELESEKQNEQDIESLDYTDEDIPHGKPATTIYVLQIDKAIEILNGLAFEIECDGDFGIAKRLGFFADEVSYIKTKLAKDGVIQRIVDSREVS